MKIRVGSRESKLAVIQSEIVMKSINNYDETIELELITMKTTGDIILDKTLDKIGGKGLFVKELDHALVDNQVDITVHSLKDMPMDTDESIPMVAFSKREDPRDVLILPDSVKEIDFTKPVGCSSNRRRIQLMEIYPQATIAPIRGNVQTRLAKLNSGDFSAIVLAFAGIKRLGLDDKISRIFSVEEILPAACQAVLVAQARKDFDVSCLNDFHCEESYDTSMAERSFVRTLDGGCSSPVAAYATINGDEISITGFYVDNEEKAYKATIKGNRKDGEKLGKELALQLKKEVQNI